MEEKTPLKTPLIQITKKTTEFLTCVTAQQILLVICAQILRYPSIASFVLLRFKGILWPFREMQLCTFLVKVR